MSTITIKNSQDLGWLGLSWPEKVAKNAKKYLLPSQESMINTRLVNNIHQRYLSLMSKGYSAIDFTSNMGEIRYRKWTGNSFNIINNFRNFWLDPVIQ